MSNKEMELLEARVAEAKREVQRLADERQHRLQSFLDMVKDDPTLLNVLHALSPAPSHAPTQPDSPKSAKVPPPAPQDDRLFKGGPVQHAYFLRVAEFLDSHGNLPQTASAICKAVGINLDNLNPVLYKTHNALFIKGGVPRRSVNWSLVDNWRELTQQDTAEAEREQPRKENQLNLGG